MPTTLPERPDYTSQRRSIFWIIVALVLIVIAAGVYLTSGNSTHDAAENQHRPVYSASGGNHTSYSAATADGSFNNASDALPKVGIGLSHDVFHPHAVVAISFAHRLGER